MAYGIIRYAGTSDRIGAADFCLPAGSVTKKTVRGKDYFYHRWTENKKRREQADIPADELENFRAQIERRKALEEELKALKKQLPGAKSANLFRGAPMSAPVRRCVPLRRLFAAIAGASASGSCTTLSTASRRTRCSFSTACAGRVKPPDPANFCRDERHNGACQVSVIQITAKDTLRREPGTQGIEAQGFHYVFLDEVTLMEISSRARHWFSDCRRPAA